MDSPVQKIKERLSIEELVSSYIKLEKAGTNFKARCPFHSEKTPSFFVSPDRGGYYCFGCAAKGDVFTFVQEFEGLDFRGALKLLAERAGVPLEKYNPKEESEKEKLYKVMEEATAYYSDNLKGNTQVLQYLKDRGLKDETIKDFRVGFAKDDWRELYSYLQKKGFKDAEIEKAGLVKRPDNSVGGPGFYDRFRGRIMFPLTDSSGRVIAFSGRILIENEKSAKYLNSPDTPIFKKSSVLYGIDKSKDSIRKNDFSIMVEGQFDLILSHQAGFKNTIATSGTALANSDKSEDNSVNNLGIIKRLSPNIVFVFDSDKAGFSASMRAASTALLLDMNVKGAQMPEGYDPADLILKKGVDAWREVIRGSKHIIEFLIDKFILMSKDNDILKTKLEIENKIIPYLQYIGSPVKKSHFISLIADKAGIKEEDIRESIKRHKSDIVEESIETIKNRENLFRKDYIERRLLGIALWQKSLAKPVVDFENIIKRIGDIYKKYEDAKEDLIFEAEVFYQNNEKLDGDVNEMLSNLEEEKLNEELERKMWELRKTKGKEAEGEILKEISELNKRKEEIKSGRQNKK